MRPYAFAALQLLANLTLLPARRGGREKSLPELLQKRKIVDGKAQNDQLDTCTAIFVKAGDKINIPGDEGHTMINTGNTWLVTVDDSPVSGSTPEEISKPSHADYSPMKEMKGFGYYVVKGKDGTPEFVKNALYKTLPPIDIQNR